MEKVGSTFDYFLEVLLLKKNKETLTVTVPGKSFSQECVRLDIKQ